MMLIEQYLTRIVFVSGLSFTVCVTKPGNHKSPNKLSCYQKYKNNVKIASFLVQSQYM